MHLYFTNIEANWWRRKLCHGPHIYCQ